MASFQMLEVSPQVDSTGAILSLAGAFPNDQITVPKAAPNPSTALGTNQSLDFALVRGDQVSAAIALSLGYGEYFNFEASTNLTFLRCGYIMTMRVPPDPGQASVIKNFYYGCGFRCLLAVGGLKSNVDVTIASFAANVEVNALASSVVVEVFGLPAAALAPVAPLITASTGGFNAATMAAYIETQNAVQAMITTRKDASGNTVNLYPRLLAVDLDTTDYDIFSRAAVDLMAMKQLGDQGAAQSTAQKAMQSELNGKTLGDATFDPNATLTQLYTSFYSLCGDSAHNTTDTPSSTERSLAKSLVG